MNERSQGIFVACTPSAVFIRVIGRGACRNSEPLRNFALGKVQEGCRKLIVDLLECEGMDSTFMGVFAGVGLALQGSGLLCLFNLRKGNLRAFDALGLQDLSSIQASEGPTSDDLSPPPSDYRLLPGTDLGGKDAAFDAVHRAIVMLECHEDLCRLNEHNEEIFHDVKRFLKEDIERHSHNNGNGLHKPEDN